jgi:hypothetical protein
MNRRSFLKMLAALIATPAMIAELPSPMPVAGSIAVATPSDVNSWKWDFGDGDSSCDPVPQHIYNMDGTYTITLSKNNVPIFQEEVEWSE